MSTFDDKAPDWDTPERIERAHAVARIIRSEVRVGDRATIIDLGAGTGLLGLAVAAPTDRLVLAEPSAGMRDAAARKVSAANAAAVSVVAYQLGDGNAPGGPFDLAVSLLVLHHVADTADGLRDVHDLLSPGGWMALADLDTEDGSFHATTAEGIHHHGFDRHRLEETARTAGFIDVRTVDATTIERDGRDYPLFLLIGRRKV